MNVLDYFLKANLYGLLFASCYWLLLRRHTFFGLNRAYLLLSSALTLALPLVHLPTQTVETLPLPVGVIALPVSGVAAAPIEAGPDWAVIGLVAYGLVAFGLMLRLMVRIWSLLRLIQQSSQRVFRDYVLVQTTDPQNATFSFFHYLVLNPTDDDNDLIIRHELVHIEQYHSADVIGLALLRAVFWACPALWLIDRMLRQVHEFLADQAIQQPRAYAQLLVDYAFGIHPDALTNGFFNPSLLKQRIIMLHQKATTRWALGKYILVLPLALGLLAMTTAREKITALVSQVGDGVITVSGRVTSTADGKALPGAIVMVSSTGKGTPTDAQGKFTLRNVPKNALLSVSFVGYTSMVIPVEGRTTLGVALAPADPNELPAMGATKAYKAIKPNPAMPIRTPPSSETINGKVYTAVEEPAVFPTGVPGLMQYVAHSLRYPAKAQAAGIQGNVLVQFVVSPTGAIGSAKVKKGIGGGCDEEALRVVRQMPKWIPGKQNGKTVATLYVIPIQFMLEKREDKRMGQALPANQTDSVKKINFFVDNSRNRRFALYNDFKPVVLTPSDSQPIGKSDTAKKLPVRFWLKPVQPPSQNSLNRYAMPYKERSITTLPQWALPGEQAELLLVEGTKQIDRDRLKDINPDDIESIEVYKGGSVLAKYKVLYGEKANKGVVIIHLKSNKTL